MSSDPDDLFNAWGTAAGNIAADIGTSTSHDLSNNTWSSGTGDW
jgi:hypothetical protein